MLHGAIFIVSLIEHEQVDRCPVCEKPQRKRWLEGYNLALVVVIFIRFYMSSLEPSLALLRRKGACRHIN